MRDFIRAGARGAAIGVCLLAAACAESDDAVADGGVDEVDSATPDASPDAGDPGAPDVDSPDLDTSVDASDDSREPPADAPEPDVPEPEPDVPVIPTGPLQVRTFASGLEVPWGLDFLPDGSMVVTERPGRMRIVEPDGSLSAPLGGMPTGVAVGGQGGMLDVQADPNFADNSRIFFSFSELGAGGRGLAVARATLDTAARSLSDVEIIFRQDPKLSGSGHFAGRLAFSLDGEHLFITAGDRQVGGSPQQELDNDLGKVFRVNLDGSAADGNPFADTAGAERMWSIGHRNIQGAAVHPDTGDLWTHEHGPQGGDEVNITRAGKNFGWPLVSWGCPYGSNPCNPIGGGTHEPDFEAPRMYWPAPSTAPSGMAFYEGQMIPEWQGKLLVGGLAGQTLWALDVAQDGPIVCAPKNMRQNCEEVELIAELDERVRDVRVGPDGFVYVLTDNTAGRILQIYRE